MNKYRKIDKCMWMTSIFFLAVPIVMLLMFWFKLYISIPCISLLGVAIYFAIKKFKFLEYDEYKKIYNKKSLVVCVLAILVLNVMSGAGGLFHQNWDYRGRNAILRDLVNKDWPVRYDYSNYKHEANIVGNKDAILSYYFAYWLPGAALGKITSSFKIASLFMLCFQTLGVLLFFYLIARYIRNNKFKYFLIFIFFGRIRCNN